MDSIRYPIGPFVPIEEPTADERQRFKEQIPGIVPALRQMVIHLAPRVLEATYREGGWSIRQIIHHMADNDMNAYLRFKRALTEQEPLGSTYREDRWAELSDYREVPVENSLTLLEALHFRFLVLLRDLPPEDYRRTLRTEALGRLTLDVALQRFVWHSRHHTAQITAILNMENA